MSAKTRVTAKPAPSTAFEISGQHVERGMRQKVEIPVARLAAGAWTSMPVVVIHGVEPGPTIWLSGAIHGDELNGIAIVRRLIKRLDPSRVRGTILAVPIVNVFGVMNGSRYLPDRRDLNRSFPGSKRGSLGARVARLFYDEVASRCELGLDFHTGSNGRCNLPQVRCDLDDEKTRSLAEHFGAPIVLHSILRDGSLRAAAHSAGIQVLLYEGGEAHRLDQDAIMRGVEGAERVLAEINVLDNAPESDSNQATVLSRSSVWTRASRAGFAEILVKLGESVATGQTVARISDSTGEAEVVVRSRGTGIVVGVLRTSHVHRGDALLNVARTDES